MKAVKSITALDVKTQVACYGAFFAMAEVDGFMHPAELDLIFQTLDNDELTPAVRDQVLAFREQPPQLRDCLRILASSPKVVRMGVLAKLLEVAVADKVLVQEEEYALGRAAALLDIRKDEYAALNARVQQISGQEFAGSQSFIKVKNNLLISSALAFFDPKLEQKRESGLDILIEQLRQRKRTHRLQALVAEFGERG